ncbi:MAG: ABC transporter substrate-binding protein [Cytophagales bacterium]|nr:ABC transporter substrate-binding protein [Cytophagales bacterium]
MKKAEFAQNFSYIKKGKAYWLETYVHKGPAIDTVSYCLAPNKAEIPSDWLEKGVFISVPVKHAAVLSSNSIGAFKLLHSLDAVAGISSKAYVYNEELQKKAEAGQLAEVGEGAKLAIEKVVGLKADLVIGNTYPNTSSTEMSRLRVFGIPFLSDISWMESTPLGRAEWIKVYGILTGKEKEAGEFFNSAKKNYKALRELNFPEKKKKILTGLPYKGVWYVPAGESYFAHLLNDAHLNYPWNDTRGSGSLAKDFEEIYVQGMSAPLWINVGRLSKFSELEAWDSRYKDFDAFRQMKVYNNNRRINSPGANDYWESGIYYPDRVLRDLIRIAYPALLPDDSLYFYKRLINDIQ